MSRRRKLAAAGVAVLILMTGCNLASRVVVEPDGSGTYSVILTVPDAPSNPGHALYESVLKGSAKSDVPLKVIPYSTAGNSGAMTTFHFLSLADLNAESQRLASSGGGGIGVDINRDATGWHFSASSAQTLLAPPAGGTAAGATGSPGGPISASALNSLLSISVVVQLPGAPSQNNAKNVTHSPSTSTFTWTLAPGQVSTTLQAATTFVGNQGNVKLSSAMTAAHAHAATAAVPPTHGSSHSELYGITAAALVLLAAGALVLSRRSVRA
jgi:hypothetical protein